MSSNSESTLAFFQILNQICRNIWHLRTSPRLRRPIYDQTYSACLHQKIEKIQQNPALVMTGVIRFTFKEKFNQHLSLESLQQRQWDKKICLKIYHRKLFPKFLRTNLHAVYLIRFPNQTVTVPAKFVKALRNEEFVTTF